MSDYPDHVLTIPNATPNPNDAAQYMYRVVKGGKVINYNLCGEFSVAYCMRDEAHTDNIDDFLDYWQAQPISRLQQALVNNGLWRKTGIPDLKMMLDDYGAKYNEMVPPVNAALFAALLVDYQLIIGVSIDNTGYLVGQGIRHWEVVERITVIDDKHSICDLYNPFTNAMEPYTWRELMTSTGAYKLGLWVERGK